MNTNQGYEKAKQTIEAMRGQKETRFTSQMDNPQEEKTMQPVQAQKTNSIDFIKNDPELIKLYKESADIGSKNLYSEMPVLKVYSVGKSQSTLKDGREPNDGWFYYSSTKTQYSAITCHVLTISKGFRAEGYQGKKDIYNQILGGVFIDDGDLKPFIMFFTGTKLSNLWDFSKRASVYTKAKPVPIPLFALTVHLTSQKIKTDFGFSWVVNLEIVKDEGENPLIVTDAALFKELRNAAIAMEETVDSIVATKTINGLDMSEEVGENVIHIGENRG